MSIFVGLYNSYNIALQLTFQAVVSTDGDVSFATFIYDNLPFVKNITSQEKAIVGFDAGDQSRGDTVLHGADEFTLTDVNTFRVDGMFSYDF